MTKFLFSCAAALLCANIACGQAADSSAMVSSSKYTYEFVYNSKLKRVEVKQVLNDNYLCVASAAKLPIVEDYNDDITIDEVTCKLNNRSLRDLKPEYSYYSVGDVFYSDSRICYFPLYLATKGSTANVTFNETLIDPRYFTSAYFSEQKKVAQKEITFKIPRWMKVEMKEYNFNGFDIKKTETYDKSDDADLITYTAHNLPAMTKEDNSPGPTYLYPHIMVLCKSAAIKDQNFTYFATLDDQYRWYRELVKGINQDNTVIAAKAKEITTGLTNDMDKIKAIFYYVQDNIRYIAFENGIAGFKPEKADEVLRKKYGDCKGMANLTKSLLASLGYDARLCWLGTNHIAYDYQTPSIAVDNHMICALNYKGKMIFLDATETYLGLNDYAERIQGRQVLVENGDKYILTRIPVAPATQNFDHETSKLAISGNTLTGSVSHLWKGEDKEDVLSGLNSIKKEKTDEAMVKYLSNDNNDYQINNLKLSKMDNPDKDLTSSYDLNFRNAVSSFSKDYYIDLDPRKEFMNAIIKIGERKHDFWFDYKTNLSKEAELAIPANYKVANLPALLNITNPDYEFHIQYQALPGKLLYKKSIMIKNTRLPTSKFAQWNKDIEQLAKAYNDNVTLKPISQ
ncbi:MAG: transglutaminase-like domain-containing protein [Mucilaginibacter sp.]